MLRLKELSPELLAYQNNPQVRDRRSKLIAEIQRNHRRQAEKMLPSMEDLRHSYSN